MTRRLYAGLLLLGWFSVAEICGGCDNGSQCAIVGPTVDASPSDVTEDGGPDGPQSLPVDAAMDTSDASSLLGRWQLIGFEDPLIVTFVGDGPRVTGTVCWIPGDCENAAHVTGHRTDLEVSFGYETAPAKYSFRFDGKVSSDGSRMGGSFKTSNSTSTVAWIRLLAGKELLDLEPSNFLIPSAAGRWVDLKLLKGPKGAVEFQIFRVYRVWFTHFGIFGDLGAFWHTERMRDGPTIVQHPDGRTLKAISLGPVAATRADLPTQMVLGTTGDALEALWLTLPDGNQFVFGP